MFLSEYKGKGIVKINRKLFSIGLASTTLFFVFSILISSIALGAQEIRLSEDTGEIGGPSIYGDKVVWTYRARKVCCYVQHHYN